MSLSAIFGYAMRTEFGRPASIMRLRTATPMAERIAMQREREPVFALSQTSRVAVGFRLFPSVSNSASLAGIPGMGHRRGAIATDSHRGYLSPLPEP